MSSLIVFRVPSSTAASVSAAAKAPEMPIKNEDAAEAPVDASSLEEHDKAELVKLLSEAGKNLDELIANGLSQFQHEAIGCRPRPGHGDTVSRLVRKRNAHINRRRVQNVLPPTRG